MNAPNELSHVQMLHRLISAEARANAALAACFLVVQRSGANLAEVQTLIRQTEYAAYQNLLVKLENENPGLAAQVATIPFRMENENPPKG